MQQNRISARRCKISNNITMAILLLLGLWISNSIIGCEALPRAKPSNSQEESRINFAVESGAPLILPLEEDVILEANTNYTLRCEASEPIEWKTAKDYSYAQLPYSTHDPKRPYGNMLYLLDIDYMNVGAYYCIKSAKLSTLTKEISDGTYVDLVNENVASTIYVYVNDNEHLLYDPGLPVLYANQFQDIIIPCKPTLPTAEVLLTSEADVTFSSTTTGRYDPTRGFVVEIRSIHDTGLYICRPKIPLLSNEEEQVDFVIHFEATTQFINKPQIYSKSRGHVYEGETFELYCETAVEHNVRYNSDWTLPDGIEQERVIKGPTQYNNSANTATHSLGVSVLTIHNAKKSDSGVYRCNVEDQSRNVAHNTYLMTVLKAGESYINLTEPNNYHNIMGRANQKLSINIEFNGYPYPTIRWYKPNGSEIMQNERYTINETDKNSNLIIGSAQMTDSGTYTIRATNGILTKQLQFNVSIRDRPIVGLEDVYVRAGEEAHLACTVLAVPTAVVSWVFRPCSVTPVWPTCNRKYDQSFNSTRNARPGDSKIEYLHDLYFTPTVPGKMYCVAANKEGEGKGEGHVFIGDISDNVTIYGIEKDHQIARGDEVVITCAALTYYYTNDIVWYKDGAMVIATEEIALESSESNYSYKNTLRFKNIQDNDRGEYKCRVRSIRGKVESRIIDIFVHEPSSPKLYYTNLDASSKINRKLGDSLELECKTEAIPRAKTEWFKDDHLLQSNDNIVIETDKLVIPFMKPENEGLYKCVASNRLGRVEASAPVKISNMPGIKLGWIFGILFIVVLLICLVLYLFVRVNRERKLLRELKAAGLANFEEGAVEHINPALTLDEQADLLPYNKVFEFPREKLKLGKQLGAGAFGVVLKAQAEGIKTDEPNSVVAVKMVKRTADNEVMRALVSELKIMVHLGTHVNVVNLLGAVTKNIAKRELMVIVEYCRYGNVQNFLLHNRKHFIDQISPDTDKIDPTVRTQRFSDYFDTHRNSDNDPRSGTRAGRPNSHGYMSQSDLYAGNVNSCATEQTIMTSGDEENMLSNNSVQPAWRSNYKTDSTEAMTITTSDLVSWAFQVARGMDYLSSKRVLHGDLAARNILLCEDNVVKICDFGLARSMYKGDNYKKQGEAPLPIKWLALESLSDHVFSTYTDVWSFGVVLWEFFSLAKVPYPGMRPTHDLYLKLKDGYRMEKPPFANNDLYDIMLECWSTNPESRPLFNVLEKRFARMLGDEVTSHYVDLNEPYLRTNSEYARRNQTDYLALMGSPDEMAPPPPRYVNGHILPEIQKASTQHSPTLTNNIDSAVSKNHSKDIVQPEEIPMLQKKGDDDSDSSPEQSRKYADLLQKTRPTPSPRHHLAETKLSSDNGDNYVNVKSPRKLALNNNNNGARPADAFSNPSYHILKTVKENERVGD